MRTSGQHKKKTGNEAKHRASLQRVVQFEAILTSRRKMFLTRSRSNPFRRVVVGENTCLIFVTNGVPYGRHFLPYIKDNVRINN